MEHNNINNLKNVTKEYLQAVCDDSCSVSDVMIHFLFSYKRSDARQKLNDLIINLQIDLTKLHENLKEKMRKINTLPKKTEFNFIKGEYVLGRELYKQLKRINNPVVCVECGIGEIYNGKFLRLQVHHIDGDNKNNEIENLSLLCPNCHSQTDSYCGKNNKLPQKFCECGSKIKQSSTRCRPCNDKYRRELANEKLKKQKPRTLKFEVTKEDLEKLVKEKPMTKIAEMFGVSDNAVKSRCKKLGIVLENRQGYWRKVETGKIVI
jgi:hypothetical protein